MNKILREDVKRIISSINIQFLENKIFLVTGATGSIASVMVYTLLEANSYLQTNGCKVVALCRNLEKAQKIFDEYLDRDDFKILIHDVTDPIICNDKIDYIIHAAGNSSTQLIFDKPVDTLSANLIGTYHLLELGRNKQIQGFLFLSSGSIYGDEPTYGGNVREDVYYPIDSMKAAENMCYCYNKQYGIATKIVRIAHTYGPMLNLFDGHVYSDFILSLLNKRDLIIKGDGQGKRAFCYITDAVIAMFKILFYGEQGEAYNMANNNCFISIKELADILVNDAFPEYHLKAKCLLKPSQASLSKIESSIDTTKLEQLGWEPRVGVKEGFSRVIESFIQK